MSEEEFKKMIEKMLYVFPNIDTLKQFNLAYGQYLSSVEAMFSYRLAEIQQTQTFINQQKAVDDILYEAGAILGDLTYLDDPDNQEQVDRISGSASQIEGFVFNLVDATKTILSINTVAEVEESQKTIEFAISNVEQYSNFLITLGKTYDTNGLVEQFVEEFTKAKVLLRGDNNLFMLKISQLQQKSAFNSALIDSERDINQSINDIDTFLQAVDKNLTQLQRDIFDNVEQGNLETVIILIVLFVAGVAIAMTTIRSMIGPLKRINLVLAKIAKGDLSHQLTVTSADEYGELSKNVNLVVADLRSLISNITDNTHLLNDSAEQSSEKIAQVTDHNSLFI